MSSAFPLPSPLAQKQATRFTKEEIRKLTDDIYERFNLNSLNKWDAYDKGFETAWPEFAETVEKLTEEYRMANFKADLKALCAPENAGEYGEWASKRGEALVILLNDNALPLLSKARELQAYMDELRKYEGKNRLFASLRVKLECLVL